jgi:hypothetical protein
MHAQRDAGSHNWAAAHADIAQTNWISVADGIVVDEPVKVKTVSVNDNVTF